MQNPPRPVQLRILLSEHEDQITRLVAIKTRQRWEDWCRSVLVAEAEAFLKSADEPTVEP